MNLNDAIALTQATNSEQIRTGLAITPQQPSPEEVALFQAFQSHCVQRGAMPYPTPALVADWINTVEDPDAACRAVEVVCDFQFLANPVATLAVRTVLERRLRTECPHSWNKADRLLFASLPPEIRSIVKRREGERDTAHRRAVHKLAEATKQQTHTSTEKEDGSNGLS